MKRQTLLIIIAIAAVVIIVGGYATWALLNSNQPGSLAATPSPTATATPEPSSSTGDTVQKQVRDASMNYIKANHEETIQLMTDLSWTGGRQETGLLGGETYIYTSAGWVVTIKYPVVANPSYTVTANYSSGYASVAWQGTYQDQTFTETSYISNINNLPTQLSIQEQVRDAIMVYIEANHNETAQYMQNLNWTGGRATPAMIVGSETYIYQTIGWNVTMQYPVVLDPIYTVTAKYTSPVSQITPEQLIVDWQGTWQNGTIIETSYTFNP